MVDREVVDNCEIISFTPYKVRKDVLLALAKEPRTYQMAVLEQQAEREIIEMNKEMAEESRPLTPPSDIETYRLAKKTLELAGTATSPSDIECDIQPLVIPGMLADELEMLALENFIRQKGNPDLIDGFRFTKYGNIVVHLIQPQY